MSSRVLIDTSAWIESMRARGDDAVRANVATVVRDGRACLCDQVRLELWNGIGGDAERRWLLRLEGTLETVPTDERVWEAARDLARLARARAVSVPAPDLVIAACARVHGLEVLHRDTHFDRLAALGSE